MQATCLQDAIAFLNRCSRLILPSLLSSVFIATTYSLSSHAQTSDIRPIQSNTRTETCEICQTNSNKICCAK